MAGRGGKAKSFNAPRREPRLTFPPFPAHTVKHACWEFSPKLQVPFYIMAARPVEARLAPKEFEVPCGRKRKLRKIATHKRKKKLRKNRHKKK